MEAALKRIIHTYAMMVDLSEDEKHAARERVANYLADKNADEHALAVEGLRYLRQGPREGTY